MLWPGGAPQRGVGPSELDFPYYDLTSRFQSTLLLVSDSPKAMDFTLAVRSSQGLMLTTAKTIQPQEKLSIDLATLITALGGDPNGAFGEGSVAVYFLGTMMPIVGQISIRNPQLGLANESEMVENEGNGWAGSGANPWHVDNNTESILFLTNESGRAARIGFVLTASEIHYYLTMLELQAHETRAINIRQLRDAQLADFRRNKIPANATDGNVNWVRLDNVPVMGRLMVISRHGHTAATDSNRRYSFWRLFGPSTARLRELGRRMRIDELRGRFTAQLIAVSFAPMLIAGPKTPGTARECPVAWFEIASLKVSPSTIDVNGTPNAAAVTAVVRAHGKLPSGAGSQGRSLHQLRGAGKEQCGV